MDETKYSHFESLKTATQTTLSIRRRIERFNNHKKGENEAFELDLWPSRLSASIYLEAISNREGTVYLRPTIRISRYVENYTCKLWFENLAGEKFSKMIFDKDDHDEFYHGERFNFDRFDPRQLFTDDVAILCFDITYYVSCQDYDPSIDDLRQKLWQNRETGFSDVTLKIGDREIKASKLILTAQSSVFKNMFTLNTIEAQTGVVEMPDTTYEAVKAFVEFIYLGSAEHFESLADQLYILADKYDVPPLKSCCVKQLKKKISSENVVKRLILAFIYNNARLKKPALKYIMNKTNAGNVSTIKNSHKWIELDKKNPKLAEEIWNAISKKING